LIIKLFPTKLFLDPYLAKFLDILD